MGRRSWFLVPLAAVVVAVVAAVVALQAGGVPSTGASGGDPATVGTPVLSARRLGPVLSQRISAAQLRSELTPFLVEVPPDTCLMVLTPAGELVYEHQPDLSVLPASLQKLVTATVAVDQLGPDTRLRTQVMAQTGPNAQGVVEGDVWLVGGGDPLLATQPYADHFFSQPQLYTPLGSLADALVAAGVRRIEGRILGDESRYDTLREVPSWPDRFAEQSQVGPLSALTVNDNLVDFVPKQEPLTPDGEPVPNPPVHAADQLRAQLEVRGITVGGTGEGTAPEGATELAGVDSPPVGDLVAEMLAESDNVTAELLTKELGRAEGGGATTAEGVAVIEETLPQLGLPAAGSAPVDGSGLDYGNRQTCRILAATLTRAQPGSPLERGLPIADQTGTLITRFEESPVAGRLRAKTGSLRGSSALAGVLPTAQGGTLEFAFVQNGDDAAFANNVELANLLDGYPSGPPPDQLSPAPVG